MKKLFALASVTALTGLVAATTAAGCSSTETVVAPTDGAASSSGDAKSSSGSTSGGAKKDGPSVGTSSGDDENPPPAADEGTVGKVCAKTTDCNVAGSANDNLCSLGLFGGAKGGDDLFSTPYCISGCVPNANATKVADLLCDGNGKDPAPGLCLPSATAGQGTCLAACTFDSKTIDGPCPGNDKCAVAFTLTDAAPEAGIAAGGVLGFCLGGCLVDADCKGTPGQKCQIETNSCVKVLNTTFKAAGTACDAAATTPDCGACPSVGGAGANKDKGVCTVQCITGAAGDALCTGKVAGWKCTAGLPSTDDKTAQLLFTGQPDGVVGQCMPTCTTLGAADPICVAYAAVAGAGIVGNCVQNAEGKYCSISAP